MNEIILNEPRTCRTCHKMFTINNDDACRYHPESFAGETAQRWMAPGETKGAGDIYNFYSCCKGKLEDPGCCCRKHLTFDDPEDVTQLRPGMHKKFEAEKKLEEDIEKITNKSLHKLTLNEIKENP